MFPSKLSNLEIQCWMFACAPSTLEIDVVVEEIFPGPSESITSNSSITFARVSKIFSALGLVNETCLTSPQVSMSGP